MACSKSPCTWPPPTQRTQRYIFRAFWRGIGPALILVINPVLQYTVFEQLKNFLITRRTTALRAAGGAASAVAVLSDWDFFFLGALSKLGTDIIHRISITLMNSPFLSSCNRDDLPLHVG